MPKLKKLGLTYYCTHYHNFTRTLIKVPICLKPAISYKYHANQDKQFKSCHS